MEVHIDAPLSLANSHRLKDGNGPAPYVVSTLPVGQDAVVDLEFMFDDEGGYTGVPKGRAAARLVVRAGAVDLTDFETDAAMMPSVRIPSGAFLEVHMRILPGYLTGRFVRLVASAAPVGVAAARSCSDDARVISKPPKMSGGDAGRASGKPRPPPSTKPRATRIGGPKATKFRAIPGARRSRAPRSPSCSTDSSGGSSGLPYSGSEAPASSGDSDGSASVSLPPLSFPGDSDDSDLLEGLLSNDGASVLGGSDGFIHLPPPAPCVTMNDLPLSYSSLSV